MKFKQKEIKQSEIEVKAFAQEIGVSEILAQILLQRNIDCKEKFHKYANPDLKDLRDPFLLDGMKECKERIEKAIRTNERILIFGDYDVDGISAVAILYKFLKDKVDTLNYFLPNRYEDGYGLTIESAKKVITQFSPNLIITVDCGISCADEIDYIKSQGIDVIVTDHHEIPENLPNTIIVDPKLPNQEYGFDGLCGAGVAMKVVETFVGKENLSQYLPICAIATVSDIVPLIDENRTIVKFGLALQNMLPKGIQLLLKRLKIDKITSQTVSFKIAPRLNATGRMGNAYFSLDLYISSDEKVLENSLKMVDELNQKRQQLSQTIFENCLETINQNRLYENKAIILKNNDWDSGLLGIACARLVDEYNKPVFLFSVDEGELKGSVRSIDGINIHTVLSSCKSFLDTFGGHSMAAGLSLKEEYFDQFKTQILSYLDQNVTDDTFEIVKYFDAKISPSDVTLGLAKELEVLEPVGCENPNPIFMTEYENCKVTKMQNFSSHINLLLGNDLKLVCFNADNHINDYLYAQKKQTLFEIQTSEFKGKLTIKGIIKKSMFCGANQSFQNISSGKMLKQLYGKKFYGDIEFFEKYEIENILKNIIKKSNGTAIVIYNLSTYQQYKSILDNFDLTHYISENKGKTAENCIIFGLNDTKTIKNYQNLIFLDTLLDTNFLHGYCGKIFSIKNQPCKVEKLYMSRDNFAVIYKAFLAVLKTNMPYSNEIEFYNCVKLSNPHLSRMTYSQFIACLFTFLELGMIKLDTKFGYMLYVDEAIKSKLENSEFYNKLNFISMINK